MKRYALTALASFLISLIFLMFFVELGSGALTETRKTALVRTLTKSQLPYGAFRFFANITGYEYANEGGTALVLMILKALNETAKINVDEAVDYMTSRQANNGGFGAFYGYDGTLLGYDLDCTYEVVHALKFLNKLDCLNKTLVANFILARYNQSSGAFHELIVEAYGKKYAMCSFSLEFRHYNAQMAYSIPNVISTYLAVSTLADLGMLDIINTTKTYEWIMSCQAPNGAFKPYPEATFSILPGWSPLVTNPFDVDSYGTGVPYTFAAVETLKNLGYLQSLNKTSKDKIATYLLSCRNKYNKAMFQIHRNYDRYLLAYTYYAVMALADLNMLNTSNEDTLTIVKYLLEKQELRLKDFWSFSPLENYHGLLNYYGLFLDTATDPIEDTFYTIMVLNATNSISYLNNLTPRAVNAFCVVLISSTAIATIAIIILASANQLKRILTKARRQSR